MKTYDEILALLDEVVAEHGADYVYVKPEPNKCVYVADGAPSCLWGHVFAKMDPALLEDGRVAIENMGVGPLGIEWEWWGEDDPLCLAAAESQDTQDNGDTWGEAREEFVSVYAKWAVES